MREDTPKLRPLKVPFRSWCTLNPLVLIVNEKHVCGGRSRGESRQCVRKPIEHRTRQSGLDRWLLPCPLLHHVQLPSLSDQVVGGKIVKKRPQNARSTIYLQATITPAAARNPFSHARESGRPSSQNLFLPADSQRRAQEEVRELV